MTDHDLNPLPGELAGPGRRWMGCSTAEIDVFKLLARGQLSRVRESVRRIDPRDRSVLLRLADVDAENRMQAISLHQLDGLEFELTDLVNAGGPDFRPWLAAIRAEHFLLWKSDGVGLIIAGTALNDFPDGLILSEHLLVARGRLRRIQAVWHLFAGSPSAATEARAMLELALADLSRAGWEEERLLSVVWFTSLWTVISWEDVQTAGHVLAETIDRLHALESPYLAVALVTSAAVAFIAGDIGGALAALDRAHKETVVAFPNIVNVISSEIETFRSLLANGPTPETLQQLSGTADDFRSGLAHGAASMLVEAALISADLGHHDVSAELAARAELCADLTPFGPLDRRALRARLTIASGEPEAGVHAIKDLRRDQHRVGLHRRAAVVALRAARDCARVGAVDASDELRALAIDDLPANTSEWTLWEAVLARPTIGRPARPPVARHEVRVLGPDIEVIRNGGSRRLPDGSARVLAVLVAERRPLTVDRLADLLWPEIDPESGRARVNTAVYRLRKLLDLDKDELVIRTRDGIELSIGSDWRVDSWEFRRLAQAGPDRALDALARYTGHFCSRQLAYDQAVLAERSALRARWVDLARAALTRGAVDPAELAQRVDELDLDEAEIIEPLAEALRALGRTAQADALRARSTVSLRP